MKNPFDLAGMPAALSSTLSRRRKRGQTNRNAIFELNDDDAYLRWREDKLEHAVLAPDELIVEINDPNMLTATERAELHSRIKRCSMAIYATRAEMDEAAVQRLAAQFGWHQPDANWLAGETGISRITVCREAGTRQTYIPYTDRAIKWHTDGYYNPPERQIHGMVLHCVQSAGVGGINRVMDHEIAYLMLRDENPDFIRALSIPNAMTIPERTDEKGIARAAQTGPVFSVDQAEGTLHMRYTARTRSIEWHAATLAAVAQLEHLLASDSPHIHSLTLENGMGLISHNVLHDRSAFTDDPSRPRLLYRARYLNRLAADQAV
ncbi:MAG: TauD/TfdA family dioxygenase [Gallionella sp.]|jgi:alpha-ketoglutarate-dependent taurine dioxygenase